MIGLGSVKIPPMLYIEFIDMNGNKKIFQLKFQMEFLIEI
jgi:hypothetical protein